MTLLDGRALKGCPYPLTLALLGYPRRGVQRSREHPRLPCRGCGGPKDSGRSFAYCLACSSPEARRLRLREQDARRRATKRAPCRKCNGPKPPGSRRALCDACLAAIPPKTGAGNGHGARVDAHLFPALPVAPLLPWVHSLIRRTALDSQYPLELAAGHTGEGGKVLDVVRASRGDGVPSARETVCDRLGIPSRRLYCWEHGIERSTSFDVADRVVTRAGWCWWDVWSGEDFELARRAFEGDDA